MKPQAFQKLRWSHVDPPAMQLCDLRSDEAERRAITINARSIPGNQRDLSVPPRPPFQA
jgi:hypothetical protein